MMRITCATIPKTVFFLFRCTYECKPLSINKPIVFWFLLQYWIDYKITHIHTQCKTYVTNANNETKETKNEPRSIIIWEFRANIVSVNFSRHTVPFGLRLQRKSTQTFFISRTLHIHSQIKFIHLYYTESVRSRSWTVFIIRVLNRMSISPLLQLLDKILDAREKKTHSREKVNKVIFFSLFILFVTNCLYYICVLQ